MNCKWIPELMICENWANFKDYENKLYDVFKNDFIITHPSFENKMVNIRKHPQVDGKEQAFFHITSKEYENVDDRCPDPRRCERIKWVRKFIENYACDPSLCSECTGVKVWEEDFHGKTRVNLLLEEERYIVILEKREAYILLITAYYLDYNHSLRKQLKRYAEKVTGDAQ